MVDGLTTEDGLTKDAGALVSYELTYEPNYEPLAQVS